MLLCKSRMAWQACMRGCRRPLRFAPAQPKLLLGPQLAPVQHEVHAGQVVVGGELVAVRQVLAAVPDRSAQLGAALHQALVDRLPPGSLRTMRISPEAVGVLGLVGAVQHRHACTSPC